MYAHAGSSFRNARTAWASPGSTIRVDWPRNSVARSFAAENFAFTAAKVGWSSVGLVSLMRQV